MKVFTALIGLFLSGQALSSYIGLEQLQFSQEEVSLHLAESQRFSQIARSCLLNYKKEHLSFYKNHCVTRRRGIFRRRTETNCLSKYYGDRKYSKKPNQRRSDGRRLKYLIPELEKYDFPIEWMQEMEPISCVGMAINCLRESFQKTNQESAWKKLRLYIVKNHSGGTAIQEALRKLGWKVFYWNPASPDTLIERARKWDQEEKNWQSKGWHEYRYLNVQRKNRYYFNTVDNKEELVGFEKTPPAYLKTIPFWMGTANTGYHVFPGTFQDVVEAHSVRPITSIDNLEFSQFNPLNGEGPKWTGSEKYRSGLMAIPPGY